ncbi:MAG: hypothetical protein K2Y40_15965 [Reyranella sp.]|nr:hypothetical protein [Reyranella sp.]
MKKAAPELVSAWKSCIGRNGAHASIVYRSDPMRFVIDIRHSDIDRGAVATIVSADNFACSISRSEMAAGVQIKNGKSISCTRSSLADSIAIDVSYVPRFPAQGLFIPGVVPVPAPPTVDQIESKIVGAYQVLLGPEGGCNKGKPYSAPQRKAKIERDKSGFKATNECGEPSRLNVVSNGTITLYEKSARVEIVGDSVKIVGGDQNVWWSAK